MITTTKTKNLDLFNISSSDINKQILIKMAKEGKDRPSQKTKLGRALNNYANRFPTANKDFAELLRKLRPDWFISIKQKANIKKRNLIRMAKEGKDRPACTTKIGKSFNNYTKKSSKIYDESFTKIIKKLRPNWLVKSSDIMKQKLIKMAKEGKDKPKKSTKEGAALSKYVNRSKSFNKSFNNQIKKLRPDWFEKTTQTKTIRVNNPQKNIII